MSELIVTHIAELFGLPADEVKGKLEKEETTKEFFENLKTSNVIYKKDEFDTLLKNKETEYLDRHAKAENINPAIYKRVSGTVKEMTEKNIAKRFGISDYLGLDDLLEKAEAKLKVAPNTDEKDSKIDELKQLVKQVEKEKFDGISAKEKEVDGFIISSVMQSAISDLPIDFEGEQLKIQRDITATMFEKKYILQRKDKKIIATDRATGEVVKDRVGDPVEVSKLLVDFAPTVTKIKTVPAGGRGDGSSANNTNTDLAKVTNEEEFIAMLKAKNIKSGTKESQQLLMEIKKANPKFKL